jgi:hypothetical protein
LQRDTRSFQNPKPNSTKIIAMTAKGNQGGLFFCIIFWLAGGRQGETLKNPNDYARLWAKKIIKKSVARGLTRISGYAILISPKAR